ncbi:hypothetical protein [Reinekea blandensis]|uniref:Transmembrane protein n=1 Tax=Reinekea blandensis MED297 TaxID=314283 RepID=A4BD59_9GAMM|nr:hypothetical protein [Reinekea blandensis]EAR09803.1 hypothetical protein MED297_05624 [Reinekea sp. MED297] [Reinekea blandensis MED297]
MNSDTATPAVKYSKTQLLIILLTPILVVISSSALYFSGWLIPEETSNNGTLLDPVLSVTDFGLAPVEITDERQWQLIQFSPNCTQACLDKVYTQRQMHIALGKYQPRIQRVLMTNTDVSAALGTEYPQLNTSGVRMSDLSQALVSRVPANDLTDHPVFVVDPFGNIMLYFTSEHDYKAQMSDLKKLLKNSTIG